MRLEKEAEDGSEKSEGMRILILGGWILEVIIALRNSKR